MSKAKTTTSDIVAKLWKECKTLQSAGVSYHNYVTELTFLLFLKMLEETNEEKRLPNGYRWSELATREGLEQLDYYRAMLLSLGNAKKTSDPVVLAIFTDAQTHIRLPKDLKALTTAIDKLDWFSAREDGLGDLYEGLLEKTTSATKTKAGQYFTPRPLIDSIVRLIQPQAGEVVQDPAAGTGGFLIAADRYIKDHTDNLYKLKKAQAHFQKHAAFVGHEWVQDTHRLCLMNLILHGIQSPVGCEDTLSAAGGDLGQADVVLTNPPFNKMTGTVNRSDFSVTATERVGPMPFLEHVVRALKPSGRAAIVMPDNILFGNGTGAVLRTWLMELCDLHTILRLPTGIFYAQGVKTNVLFFTRGKTDKANTKAVWFYDMRANMPAFGKTAPMMVSHFADFERCFGTDPLGKGKRKDQGEEGRFRKFTREQIRDRNDSLDVTWLRDDAGDSEDQLTEPEDIAAAIIGHLRSALEEIEVLAEEIEPASATEAA
ncbi:MAG: SAM-dependent methyltransferase [Mesorhizobium sp.]|uniref:class I SAM-dependent DNA methyltransferase n=1 Tax=Mesorhizobium sp. TaxID=1871066 RepID=UPI000FE61190|nr:N-6 DNA methylase [Mesorhizobium sp.]RWI18629.1 MAG: SAM-dependent methyltransferase [Mesorhizobium sp.]RWK93393.1 MAG: SAM-dependent methyltransferase [Mesorhizobium sp.]TJW41507.1 MAG: SAM-dependent methyltransferase [Mesorhizobium sp.]